MGCLVAAMSHHLFSPGVPPDGAAAACGAPSSGPSGSAGRRSPTRPSAATAGIDWHPPPPRAARHTHTPISQQQRGAIYVIYLSRSGNSLLKFGAKSMDIFASQRADEIISD